MDIQKIDRISLLVDNNYSRPVQDFRGPKAESPKIPWTKTPDSAKEITPLFSEAAVRLQQMDQQIDQIGRQASSLKEEMVSMQRTLPPFPPGSEERVRLLKSYIGLRKLIEQLTVPPEVPFFSLKDKISIPELGDQPTDREWEAAIRGLEKTQEVILQKKASLETGMEI